MNIITLIINLIIALPKIFELIKELTASLEKIKKHNKEIQSREALQNLKNAPTHEERESAADQFLDNN